MSTLRGSYSKSQGWWLIRVLHFFPVFPVNSCIRLLLCDVHVHFDCAGSHKLCAASFAWSLFVAFMWRHPCRGKKSHPPKFDTPMPSLVVGVAAYELGPLGTHQGRDGHERYWVAVALSAITAIVCCVCCALRRPNQSKNEVTLSGGFKVYVSYESNTKRNWKLEDDGWSFRMGWTC